MTAIDDNNNKVSPAGGPPQKSRLTLVGFIVLWIASLAFLMEFYNLAVVKNFQVDFDPSFEILVAAFCLLMAVLGGLLLWRGRRVEMLRRPGNIDRNLNRGILASSLLIVMVVIAGVLVYGSNQKFLREQSDYVRPAPRPDYTLGEFPTPALPQPTPTFNIGGRYLAGSLIGSIDHLRVGDLRISMADDNQSILYIQVRVQRTECLIMRDSAPNPFAVEDSIPAFYGPLPVKDGRFLATQDFGFISGKVVTDQKITGTMYLVYRDPQSGQTCDLGTFEFDAFEVEK